MKRLAILALGLAVVAPTFIGVSSADDMSHQWA